MISDIKDYVHVNGRLIDQKFAHDNILNANVALQLYEKVVAGRVKRQELGPEGKIVGRYDSNPILNSMIYEVELPNCQVKNYVVNDTTKNMLSQVDYEGYNFTLFDKIVYYKRHDTSIDKTNNHFIIKRGQRHLIQTTQSWNFLVACNDGSETWILLNNTKE